MLLVLVSFVFCRTCLCLRAYLKSFLRCGIVFFILIIRFIKQKRSIFAGLIVFLLFVLPSCVMLIIFGSVRQLCVNYIFDFTTTFNCCFFYASRAKNFGCYSTETRS